MPDREFGAIDARLAACEKEIERHRNRMHDFESSTAAIGHLVEAIRELRDVVETVPVTQERVAVLTSEMQNVKRALWSFTFALVGGAISFAFVAIQFATS